MAGVIKVQTKIGMSNSRLLPDPRQLERRSWPGRTSAQNVFAIAVSSPF